MAARKARRGANLVTACNGWIGFLSNKEGAAVARGKLKTAPEVVQLAHRTLMQPALTVEQKIHQCLSDIPSYWIERDHGTCEPPRHFHAVEKAVANAKRELIHDHIDHRLDEAVRGDAKSASAALAEFKVLSKYL